MDKFVNVGWPEMLLMALFGFLMVFTVLVLLIFVMKAMGWFFTREHKAKVAATATTAHPHDHAISDQESEMLTINRIARAYSPWNSKIHGLTQLPEKK